MNPAHNNARKSIRTAADPDEIGGVLFKVFPECVLTKILSSLTTKEAVRTSILNKTWETRWFSIYNLHFNDRDLLNRRYSKDSFCSFVDRVLTHCDNTIPLQNFTLVLSHIYGPRITTWIAAAIRRSVKNLTLEYTSSKSYPISLPGSFFRKNCLQELRLNLPISFHVSFYRFFGKLKVLELKQVTIETQLEDKRGDLATVSFPLPSGKIIWDNPVVMAFPNLEKLQFSFCEFINFTRIVIDAPMLTEFAMGYGRYRIEEENSRGASFELLSPNLKILNYIGDRVEFVKLPNPSPFIVEATFKWMYLEFQHYDVSYMSAVISRLAQVKRLHLSAEVLTGVDSTNQLNAIPLMLKMKTLKVTSENHTPLFGLSLLKFVHKTPFVDTVELEMIGASTVHEDYNEAPAVSPCVANQLRKLKLVYTNRYKWSSVDVLLLKYMVMNAQELTDIEIYAFGNRTVPKKMLRKSLKSELPVPNNLDRISMVIF